MGGDGGSIPHRTEMVKTKKKAEQVERDIRMVALWRMCALTSQPLLQPIVTCPLGRLYTKEKVIEALLEKRIQKSENGFHIKSIKDLKELHLTANPQFDENKASLGDRWRDLNVSPFICPVSGLEMNGKHRFCVIWKCGCVISEKALKEVESNGICHKCGGAYSEKDVLVLNGSEEEQAEYLRRLELRREEAKKAKAALAADKTKEKAKKRKNKEKAGESSSEKGAKTDSSIQDDASRSQVFKSLFTTSDAAKKQPKAHWVTYNPLYN